MSERPDRVTTDGRMGRGRASAIPARLAGWNGWAERQNEALRQAALRLDAAIDALNRSQPAPDLLTRLDPVGAGVIRYVAANAATDAWVGSVGAALLDLARSRLPAEAARDAGNTAILAGGLVTTTDSRIAARVEPRPADLDQRLEVVRRLADRVAATLDAGDGPGPAPLEKVRALAEDPEGAAAFFTRLGPQRTVTWAAREGGADTMGPVLAAASRSHSWPPEFAETLFADRVPATLGLLTKGVFGADFLAAAGDSWLLLGRDDDDSTAGDHEVTTILEALARDPDAALAFLVESSQADADAALPQSRLTEILLEYGTRLEAPGPLSAALSGLLARVATAPSAGEPYGGPFGGQTHAGVLLFDLAAMPLGMVPDPLLPAVAAIVAGNLDALLHSPLTGWQERVLRLALLDRQGGLDPERRALVETGFAAWRAAAQPGEYRPRTRANRRAWDLYLERAGSLAGLLGHVGNTPFEAALGAALRTELETLGVDPGPEVARAQRAFSEATGA